MFKPAPTSQKQILPMPLEASTNAYILMQNIIQGKKEKHLHEL